MPTNPIYDNAPYYHERLQVSSSPASPPSPDGSKADPLFIKELPTDAADLRVERPFFEEYNGAGTVDYSKILSDSGGKAITHLAWAVIQVDDLAQPITLTGAGGKDDDYTLGMTGELTAEDESQLGKFEFKLPTADHKLKINAKVI